MLVKLLQSENALFPILVTASGIVTSLKLQPLKQPLPIVSTDSGMETSLQSKMELQPLKPLICFIPLQITTDLIVVRSLNASSAIASTGKEFT